MSLADRPFRLWAPGHCASAHEHASRPHRRGRCSISTRPSRAFASHSNPTLFDLPAFSCPFGPNRRHGCPFDDPSSQSNYPAVKVTHADFDVSVDFERKEITGAIVLRAEVGDAPADELVLDTRDLAIASCAVDDAAVAFEVQSEPHPVMGAALAVKLGRSYPAGATLSVRIEYSTSPSSSAVQWLRPEQTAGGSHPYLFTQCQAIHARALYPCQDTPAAKLTYAAKVTVPAPLRALMSAIPVGEGVPSGAAGKTTFAFEQTVPISPYPRARGG